MINIIGLVWTILALVGQPSGHTGSGHSKQQNHTINAALEGIEARLDKGTKTAEPKPWFQPLLYDLAIAGLGATSIPIA